VYKEAKSILHNNGMVKNKGKVNDSIDLLKAIIEFYAVKMNKMNEKILDLSKHKNSSQKGLNQMKQRLGILNEKLRKLGQSGIKQDPVPRITISLIA
jgi:wobble nucleotide-excising tRNase